MLGLNSRRDYPYPRLAARTTDLERQHLPSPPPVGIVAGMQENETWAGDTGVVVSADETEGYVKIGHQSLKVTMAGAVSAKKFKCWGAGATDGMQPPTDVRGNIGVWVKIDDVSIVTELQVRLCETKDDYTNYHGALVIYGGNNYYNLQDGVWKLCWIGREAFTASGSPTAWSTAAPDKQVEAIWFQVTTTGAAVIWIGGVLTQSWPKAYITVSFDDTYDSLYTDVLPAFNARGWKFTGWISKEFIGDTDRCTLAQLNAIYADGHDLGCHRWDHSTTFTTSTTHADVHAELLRSLEYWQDQGWFRGLDHIAWPANAGFCNGNDMADLARLYFKSSRIYTSWDGMETPDAGPPVSFNQWGGPIIPWHRYNLPTQALSDSTPIATFRTRLESSIANNHIYDVYSHHVNVEGGPAGSMTPSYWLSFLALLDEKVADGVAEVISLSQRWNMVYDNPNWDYASTGIVPASGYGALAQVW